jgi:hypothetical protein
MDQQPETVIVDWDDGHRPGATSQGTKVAFLLLSLSSSFL